MVPYKNKEKKKCVLKQNDMTIPKLDPETMSPLDTKDTKVHAPQLTYTLVGKASEKGQQKNELCDSDKSEFFEDDSDDDDTIDNIV